MERWLARTVKSEHGFATRPTRVAAVVALFALPATMCLGAELSFSEFQQINQENYAQVQTGTMEVHCKTYERRRLEDLQRRAAGERERYERRKQEIEASNSLPRARKTALLQDLEKRMLEADKEVQVGNLDTWSDENQTYTFDLGARKCRIESQSLTPGANDQSCIILRSEGTQVQYFTKYDYGIVNHMNNRQVTRKMPAQFGTVTPKWFVGMSAGDVTTTTEVVDGQEVIVYDVAMPDQFRTRIYADPALGYRYRKMEVLHDGQLIRSYRAKEYEMFDGIPVPTVHEAESYEPGAPGKPIMTETMEVRTAQLNQEIDPRAFRIAYNSKSKIMDMTLGMLYRPYVDVAPEDMVPQSVEDVVETILDIKVNADIAPFPTENSKVMAQVTLKPEFAGEPLRPEAATREQPLADSTATSVDKSASGYMVILLVVAFLAVVFLGVMLTHRKAQG